MSFALTTRDNDTKLPMLTDGLASYLDRVHAMPVLTAEEESALAWRYRLQGDLMAAQQLVLSQLRYVVRIARGYTGYGIALNDLIQEGTVGLMKAVKRFEPEQGVRLVSFAVHWIKSEIHDFVIRNWRIVKVATTKAQRKLFFNLRAQKEAKKRLGWFSLAEVQAVANDLGVTPQEVMEMESRLNARDDAFDGASEEDSEECSVSPSSYVAGPSSEEPEGILLCARADHDAQDKLEQALSGLDPRSLDIVSQRWLCDKEAKASLKALAEKHGVSIERVRQLEKAAFEKMRQWIEVPHALMDEE